MDAGAVHPLGDVFRWEADAVGLVVVAVEGGTEEWSTEEKGVGKEGEGDVVVVGVGEGVVDVVSISSPSGDALYLLHCPWKVVNPLGRSDTAGHRNLVNRVEFWLPDTPCAIHAYRDSLKCPDSELYTQTLFISLQSILKPSK